MGEIGNWGQGGKVGGQVFLWRFLDVFLFATWFVLFSCLVFVCFFCFCFCQSKFFEAKMQVNHAPSFATESELDHQVKHEAVAGLGAPGRSVLHL